MTVFLTEINFLISHLLVYGLFWGDHIYSPKVVMLPKIAIVCLVFLFFFCFLSFVFFFRAAPAAHGASQARGLI